MSVEPKYMALALELASRGAGYVSPNPLVGAVIVKNGRIIGQGHHQRFGGPHAEIVAFSASSESVEGATLYVNLEPCCHEGKTPPCVNRIIERKISRVVIGCVDPNPRVNGKGIDLLNEAGIEVITGVLSDESEFINRFFCKFIQKALPYIVLKVAETQDGKISVKGGGWFTSEASRMRVHKIRGEIDAVLVGVGTILADNPQLNVRDCSGRNPTRIVLDTNLRTPLESQILNCEDPNKTWIITSQEIAKTKVSAILAKGVKVIHLGCDSAGRIDLKELSSYLFTQQVSSLLVEGGREVWRSFLNAGIVDELVRFQSLSVLGDGQPFSLEETISKSCWQPRVIENLGGDQVTTLLRS